MRGPRWALKVLQRYTVHRDAVTLSVLLPFIVARAQDPAAPVLCRIRARMWGLLCVMAISSAHLLLCMPRDNSVTAIPQRYPSDFGDAEFVDHFR